MIHNSFTSKLLNAYMPYVKLHVKDKLELHNASLEQGYLIYIIHENTKEI